jgi:hypothetical protein
MDWPGNKPGPGAVLVQKGDIHNSNAEQLLLLYVKTWRRVAEMPQGV